MSRFLFPLSSLAIVAVVAVHGSVRADVIFDSGLNPGSYTSGSTADLANSQIITSTAFTLGTAAQISEVQWAGKYFTGNVAPPSDDFTIRFYDYSGSTPSSTPLFEYAVGNAVNRVSTGITDYNGQTVYSYDAQIPLTSLAAGRYTFSVQDDTRNIGTSGSVFFWTTAYSPGHQVFYDTYLNDNFNTSFKLLNTTAVPEPASLVMLGLGSLGLLALARRTRCQGHRTAA